MKYLKKLVGDRIYLSPITTDDAEIFTEWLNDFETTDYIARSQQIVNLAGEKKWIEENANTGMRFGIITLEDDKMIGTVSIENIDHFKGIGTLGIFIGDKNYRENGYGTEAIRLVLEFGFKYLNLRNIDLGVLDFNERAKSCYRKCGFKECGRRTGVEFVSGKFYDHVYMEVLADEFEGDWIRNKNI